MDRRLKIMLKANLKDNLRDTLLYLGIFTAIFLVLQTVTGSSFRLDENMTTGFGFLCARFIWHIFPSYPEKK